MIQLVAYPVIETRPLSRITSADACRNPSYAYRGAGMHPYKPHTPLSNGLRLTLLVGASRFELETSCAQGILTYLSEMPYFQLLTVQ